ncbi:MULTISPECIES: hypothetical protein [unclassified Arenibacter]|jgi:hypothetical protein|uniref:hypothetical protein n=1 Tax=unclassified Arenibacter TaxID=2615047 RepID=UPI000E357B1D|nr:MULTISPECIES: hypothetical protein [unclassified Arenibacter]MCM4166035.1 hypothetical protein [Arenibacter sp. A80]RFT54352.1 hypothetical protein D0S24_20730 [Arenibacter sp. P308M17]
MKEPASGVLAKLSNTLGYHKKETIQELSEYLENAILNLLGRGKASLDVFGKSLIEEGPTFKQNYKMK